MSELEQKVIEIIKSKCMEVNDQSIVTIDSNLDSLDIDSDIQIQDLCSL